MDIEAIKRKLLVKYPFFGSIVANTNYIEDSNCYSNGQPTGGTDGTNVYYHPDYLRNATEEERLYLFAHEICHIAFDHIFRSEGKDPELWNIATDAVVNANLKQDGIVIPKDSINIPEAIYYDAESFYEKLLEDKKRHQDKNSNESQDSISPQKQNSQNESRSGSSENSQASNIDVGYDTHNMWQKGVQKRRQEDEDANNNKLEQSPHQDFQHEKQDSGLEDNSVQQSSDTDMVGTKGNINSKDKRGFFDRVFHKDWNDKKGNANQDEQTIEKTSEDAKTNFQREKNEKRKEKEQQIKKLTDLSEKKSFKQNSIDRIKQLEELRKSLASQSHCSGKGSNGDERKVTDIGVSKPLIDWRYLLKEAVRYDVDWSYRNASIEDGVVTPYLEQMPKPETEILLDTSGSVSETLLRNFLRECKNILKESKVKVGCFDDEFYGFTEIRNQNDIDNMPFLGGGGTNFDVAVNVFTGRVENKIIFTDGESSMPDRSIDAIWIVFGGKKINPKGGKVINITDEQLKRLLLDTSNHYSNVNMHR